MANRTLQEAGEQAKPLPQAERLLLIERVAHGLRTAAPPEDWDAQLIAMAADPDIQRELAAANREFACTEMGGLERRLTKSASLLV